MGINFCVTVPCLLRPQSSKLDRHGFTRPRADVQLGLTSLVFQQQSHLVKKQHFRQPCPIDLSRYLIDSHYLLHHRHRCQSQLYSVWHLRGTNPKVHRLGHKYFSSSYLLMIALLNVTKSFFGIKSLLEFLWNNKTQLHHVVQNSTRGLTEIWGIKKLTI